MGPTYTRLGDFCGTCGLLHVVPDTGRLWRCRCEDSHGFLNENFMMVVTEYGA